MNATEFLDWLLHVAIACIILALGAVAAIFLLIVLFYIAVFVLALVIAFFAFVFKLATLALIAV